MRAAWAWDGQHGWDMDPSGAVQPLQKSADIAERRTAVYGDAYGYFFPGRILAECSYVGRRKFEGREYEVVRVKPGEGAAVELWMNRQTHLIERQVGSGGEQAQSQRYGDFRQVNGVTVPFSIQSFDLASGKLLDSTQVRSYQFNIGVVGADFAAPPAKTARAGS